MVVSFSSSTDALDMKHGRRTSNDAQQSIYPLASANIRPISTVLASPPSSYSLSSSTSSTSSHSNSLAHSHTRLQSSRSSSAGSTTPSLSPSSIISLQRTARQEKRHYHQQQLSIKQQQQQRQQVHFAPGLNRSALLYTSVQMEQQQELQRQQQKFQKQLDREQQQRNRQASHSNREKVENSPLSTSSSTKSRLSNWTASIRKTLSSSKSSNNSSSGRKKNASSSLPLPVTAFCSGGPTPMSASPMTSIRASSTAVKVELSSRAELDSFVVSQEQQLNDLDHQPSTESSLSSMSVPQPSSAPESANQQQQTHQKEQENDQQVTTAHNKEIEQEKKASNSTAPIVPTNENVKKTKKFKSSSFPRWSRSVFSSPPKTKNNNNSNHAAAAAAGTAHHHHFHTAAFDPSTMTSSPISSPYDPDDQPRIRLQNQRRRRKVGAGLITIFCIAAIVILVLC